MPSALGTPTRRIFDGFMFLPTVELAQGISRGYFNDTLRMRIFGSTEDRACALALLARSLVAARGCQVVDMADHTDLTVEEDFSRPFSVTVVDQPAVALAQLIAEGYAISWDPSLYAVGAGGLVAAGTPTGALALFDVEV